MSPPARDALWAKHFNPMTAAERNGGGHLRFIDGFLERSGGPFLLGSAPTIADLFLFFALEAFSRDVCFGNRPAQIYPRLGVFQEAVADLDGLKERLASSARVARLNALQHFDKKGNVAKEHEKGRTHRLWR